MREHCRLAVLAASLLSALCAQTPLFISGITVIDATGSAAQPAQSVLIRNGRIEAIGPAGKVRPPRGARVVDAAGKFLIPGLWDMHTHLAGVAAEPSWSRDALLPLLLANGITGVRDMGGDLEALNAWRRDIGAGKLQGPQIVASGPMLIARGQSAPDQLPVSDASETRAAVRDLKQRGADFIKVISLPSREAFLALAEECRTLAIPFVGHVPSVVTATEASDAGMRSIEHSVYSNLAVDVSTRGEEIRLGLEKAHASLLLEAVDSYSPDRAAPLAGTLLRNRTWFVPTLYSILKLGAPDAATPDPLLKFLPARLRGQWTRGNQASEATRLWWAKQ